VSLTYGPAFNSAKTVDPLAPTAGVESPATSS
jgi:hypothetical protein